MAVNTTARLSAREHHRPIQTNEEIQTAAAVSPQPRKWISFRSKRSSENARVRYLTSYQTWMQQISSIFIFQTRNPEPPPHSPTGGFYDKPPIPPRGVPPPVPQRQSSVEKVSEVQMRPKNMNGNGELNWKWLIEVDFNFFSFQQRIITATRLPTVRIHFNNRNQEHQVLRMEATETQMEMEPWPKRFGWDKAKDDHQVSFKSFRRMERFYFGFAFLVSVFVFVTMSMMSPF